MKLPFGFNISKNSPVSVENYQTYSSPFRPVGDANLSLPHIDPAYVGTYIPFGTDNLFPQLVNQLYYTSPLHSSITDFKINSVLGGGYEIGVGSLTNKQKVDVYAFESKIGGEKGVEAILYDVQLHNRLYFKCKKVKGGAKILYKICPSKVRNNADKSIYYLCNDWARLLNVQPIKKYKDAEIGEEFIWTYENLSVGQDTYAIPSYSSANNWMFLDGEMSYLQKSNILNSIFPAFAALFPKKPASKEEMLAVKNSIEKLKGASNAGKTAAFFANKAEDLPTFETIPTNSNDRLFSTTTENIDSKICQAHIIDPILMGIRVSGKLGSGSDIKQAYVIFEKNTIMPLRKEITNIMNSLLDLVNLPAKITINDFQIINETIIETEDDNAGKTIDALNSMSPLLATKVLNNLTPNEVRALADLPPIDGGDIMADKNISE